MVAFKLASVAALLQLASAAAIKEARHYPTFGLRIIADGTPYHNKYVHLSAVAGSPLQIGEIPNGDSGHSIDAEFFVREDGHLSYGQPGSQKGTYVLAFDGEQGSWSGVTDAYFLPEKTASVSYHTGTVKASEGGKNVVAFEGLELKVRGRSRWQVCPTEGGKHQLSYNSAIDDPEFADRDSAADHCTDVVVKKQDLE